MFISLFTQFLSHFSCNSCKYFAISTLYRSYNSTARISFNCTLQRSSDLSYRKIRHIGLLPLTPDSDVSKLSTPRNDFQRLFCVLQKENEIKSLLTILENKFLQLDIIHSSDIMRTLNQLEMQPELITEADLNKLLWLMNEAAKREFRPTRNLVEQFWNIATSVNGFKFTCDYLAELLSLSLLSSHYEKCKDIWKYMEDNEIKLNQEIGQLLVANLCRLGETEEVERCLEAMKSCNLSVNEDVYSSLLILNGILKNAKGIESVILDIDSAKIERTTVSDSASVIAYTMCGEWEQAVNVVERVKVSPRKFTPEQYSDIVLCCALNINGLNECPNLDYIVDSKNEIAGDIDLKKLILRLIHSDQPAKGIHILCKQTSYLTNPHWNSNGALFIRELVRSKHSPSLICDLCTELRLRGINLNAFQVALDIALSEHRVELVWKLLRAIKGRGAPVREHYFWPLFALKFHNNDHVAKTLRILEGMRELGIEVHMETLSEFAVPNLLTNDAEITLQMLSNAGISKMKATTPLLTALILKGDTEQALRLVKKSIVPIRLHSLVAPLSKLYRQDSGRALLVMQHLLLGRSGIEAAEFGRHFIKSVVRASKEPLGYDQVDALKMELKTVGIADSSDVVVPSVNDEDIPFSALPPSDLQYEETHSQSEMSVDELEGHLIELKEKNMNTRGVLRKLLLKYSVLGNKEKLAKVIHELKEISGDVSPGMASSIMYKNVQDKDADAALEGYFILRFNAANFCIDSYKVVDLCCLLAENNRVADSISVLRNYISSVAKSFHRPSSFTMNCNRLLTQVALNESYAATREICSLLLTGGLAVPSPVILGPLIKARIVSNDSEAVVAEAEELYSTYRILPMRVEILVFLLKKLSSVNDEQRGRDLEPRIERLIERVVSLISSSRGVRQTKCDILKATLQIGNEKEVIRIVQEVDEAEQTHRVRDMCKYMAVREQADYLLLLFSASRDCVHLDRLYICEALLNIYTVQRKGEMALSLWSLMQEEGLRPSPSFMDKLSKLLGTMSQEQQSPFL